VRRCSYVGAALVAFLGGCGATDDSSTSSGSGSVASTEACGGGRTTPVTIADAVETLSAHGFEIISAARSQLCGDRVAAYLTNSGEQRPFSANAEERGHLICLVYREPFPKGELRERKHSGKIDFYGGNLRCTIYIREEDSGRGIEPLRSALRELVPTQ
jgi:hypothetical protein